MATADELTHAIEPGSTEYGQRQLLEEGLAGLTTQGGPMPGATPPAGGGGLGIPSNPLDPLLSGELDAPSAPLTDGLSFGPGDGPLPPQGISDATVDRLRIIALEAQSPVLRHLARRALRSSVREIRSA